MTSKFAWHVLRNLRKVWVRVVSFALLAVVTAVIAQMVAPLIPTEWTLKIGADAVDDVLNILASSMLAVTTFSLAIAISAFAAAASSATPRATALLQEDATAQNVLATFLGAFLFSLVGIIALHAGYYSSAGRLVLFVMTAGVIIAVIVALLRWISHLMTFGRMGDTLDRVEAAAQTSLDRRLAAPYLQGRPLRAGIPGSTVPMFSDTIGYIQHIDVGTLQTCAEELGIKIWVNALPGAFVHKASTLFHTDREIRDKGAVQNLRSAVTVGTERNFDQDPRFGLIVLAEIASRALSPAVNDPGTAISVIGRLVRILAHWNDDAETDIMYPSVFIPSISSKELIEDGFRPIIRDGASTLEVQIRVRKALHALATMSPPVFGGAASLMVEEARARAEDALTKNEYDLLTEVDGPRYRETVSRT